MSLLLARTFRVLGNGGLHLFSRFGLFISPSKLGLVKSVGRMIRRKAIAAILVLLAAVCASAQDADVLPADVASLPSKGLSFCLPFRPGQHFKVLQGVEGTFSHYGLNRHAWDFDLPEDEPVCAAAGGRVVCVQQSFTAASLDANGRTKANRVILDHGFGLFSQYLHLKANSVTVREGDTVTRGQIIARSGNTGYSTRPHLHFQVQDALGQSILVRFADVPADGIPKEGQEYFSQNWPDPAFVYPGDSPFPVHAFEPNGVFLSRCTFSGVRLFSDKLYELKGRIEKPCHQVAVYLLPPDGGRPLWAHLIPVSRDGNFEATFMFAGVRAAVPSWHTETTESNCFALAIAPVNADGTYWSEISVPVFLR
jgi:hypothetical protein